MKSFTYLLWVLVIFITNSVIIAQTPVKVNSGSLVATKTYQHSFVENGNNTLLAYRYFADSSDQPETRDSTADNCDLMIYNISSDTHTKLYDIADSDTEYAHGSEAIVWIGNDRLYYNGRLFSTATMDTVWNLRNLDNTGSDDRERIKAWRPPINNNLYVNIRRGSERGFYALDVTTLDTRPPLTSSERIYQASDFAPTYGNVGDIEFTYIYPSTNGSNLFFVIFNSNTEISYCFTSSSSGGTETLLSASYWNGHVAWYDDNSLLIGRNENNITRHSLNGTEIEIAGGFGGHISISHDNKWIVGDNSNSVDPNVGVYIYPYKNTEGLKISQDIGYYGDYHPSFSRDGNRVYYQGVKIGESYQGVFYTDVTGLVAGDIAMVKTEAESSNFFRSNYVEESHLDEKWLKATSATAYISSDFYGIGGKYTVNVQYRDEYDGESIFELWVGGTKVDDWIANQTSGSSSNDVWRIHSTKGVTINDDDEIKVIGKMDQDEYARIDWVEIKAITTGKTEAESSVFNKTNYNVENYWVTATSDPANISSYFNGSNNNYTIKVQYRDENDGASDFELWVDNTKVGDWKADSGGDTWRVYEKTNVTINNGEEIKVIGKLNSGEPARIDWVHITHDVSGFPKIHDQIVNQSIPTEITLEQNYPNPFNPATVINYHLPYLSNVSLKIYDILGNEVAALIDEKQNSGDHEVKFNAGNLSTGVYFYELRVDNFREVKKMILLK